MATSVISRNCEITYLGHATLLIQSPAGKRIIIDPWTSSNPFCPEQFKSANALGTLDLALITHIHADHVGDAESLLKASAGTRAVCVPEVAGWLQSKGVQSFIPMNIGGSVKPDGTDITISMTQAFHTSSFTEPDGVVVHGGDPVGFVIELENGFTIYAAGDTGVFGDMALIKEMYAPDLALLPIGDHYTMGPRGAAIAMRLLGTQFVVPIHYGTFPVLTGTPEALREQTKDLPNVQIIALKPGETLT